MFNERLIFTSQWGLDARGAWVFDAFKTLNPKPEIPKP